MRVDERLVGAFLQTRYGPDVANVALLGAGDWSQAFAFDVGDDRFVIRVGAHRSDFQKDRRAAARFAAEQLPIPEIIEIGDAFDQAYAISERVEGDPLDGLDGDTMRATLPSLFAALDGMRDGDVADTTGFGPWSPDGTGAFPSWTSALVDIVRDDPRHRTHGWHERLESSPTGSRPFIDAFQQMRGLLPACPARRDVVHADLLHNNVLAAGGEITGVLDWGCSLYGDFLYDLAWLSYWQPWYPAWAAIDFRAEARMHYKRLGLNVADFETRVRCYEIHIGLGAQAYNAYTRRWIELARCAERTLEVLQRP